MAKPKFVASFLVADMSADTKIAELLTELHQLIKQTQVSTGKPQGVSVTDCAG